MRTSSNPAFRNLPTQGGHAGFDRQGGAMAGGAAYADARAAQADFGRAGVGERPLTVDDVVMKSAVCIGLAILTGVATILTGAFVLTLPAFLVGFVVSLIIIFKQSSNAALVLTYSATMGIALGGITGLLELQGTQFQGIGFQAVVGTIGVFVGMLVVYKTGAVKVTPKFTKWLMGAMVGVVVLMLANLLIGLFNGTGFGLREPTSPLAWIFSIVVIGVAAFSLLLDFDMADKAVKGGAPAKFAWYIAFGLMTTLVWLYLEILRLLSYIRGD